MARLCVLLCLIPVPLRRLAVPARAAHQRSGGDDVRPGTQLQFVVRDTTTSMAEAG